MNLKYFMLNIPLMIVIGCLIFSFTFETGEERNLALGYFIGPVIFLASLFQIFIWVGSFLDKQAKARNKPRDHQ